MTFELDCWGFISSCITAPDLIGAGETVYIITKEGQFTDTGYLGYVEATVTQAYKDCDHYSYAFDLVGDLPAGVAKLSKCDILTVSCSAPSAQGIYVSAGASSDISDTSGGEAFVAHGGRIHLFSSDGTVSITVSEGSALVDITSIYATSLGGGEGEEIIPPI